MSIAVRKFHADFTALTAVARLKNDDFFSGILDNILLLMYNILVNLI